MTKEISVMYGGEGFKNQGDIIWYGPIFDFQRYYMSVIKDNNVITLQVYLNITFAQIKTATVHSHLLLIVYLLIDLL